MIVDTKLKGDIAEQAVVLAALQRGWGVLQPVGDRLPYDLVLDIGGRLLRIQVKAAWWDESKENYVVDNRRTKTNRRQMIRANYVETDFDFAIIYLQEIAIFYIFPVKVFIAYGSEIHFVEVEKRQRRPKSAEFKEAWELLSK